VKANFLILKKAGGKKGFEGERTKLFGEPVNKGKGMKDNLGESEKNPPTGGRQGG